MFSFCTFFSKTKKAADPGVFLKCRGDKNPHDGSRLFSDLCKKKLVRAQDVTQNVLENIFAFLYLVTIPFLHGPIKLLKYHWIALNLGFPLV